MLRPRRELNRFLLSSPSWMVGEFENEFCLLTPAFPDIRSPKSNLSHLDGPYRRSFISLTFEVEMQEAKGQKSVIREDYGWVADHIADVLSVFYGKLIENCGCTEAMGTFNVPSLRFSPQPNFAAPPFNDRIRAASGVELNMLRSEKVITNLLTAGQLSANLISLLRGCSFYRASLQNYSSDPMLSFTTMLSSLEAIIPLFDFSEKELDDPQLNKVLAAIEEHVPNHEEISSIIKKRIFQVRRKCARLVARCLDSQFFAGREALEEFYTIKEDEIEWRIKAAYDLRSMFLHTGKSHGVWINTLQYANAEIVVGDPIMSDAELKKLIVRAPTLAGLERIVQYCLYTQVVRLLGATPTSIP